MRGSQVHVELQHCSSDRKEHKCWAHLALLRGARKPLPRKPCAVRLWCVVTDGPSIPGLLESERSHRLSNKVNVVLDCKAEPVRSRLSFSGQLCHVARLGPAHSRDCMRCHGCIRLKGGTKPGAVTVTMSRKARWPTRPLGVET